MVVGTVVSLSSRRFVARRGVEAFSHRAPSFVARSTSTSSTSTAFSAASPSSEKEEVDPGVVEGTELRVLKYPHPSLRVDNAEFGEDELDEASRLAKEMFLVMYAAQGVGLAAPQVGVNKRLMVYNASGDRKKWLDETVLVNPRIVEYGEGKDVAVEGCLSFPDMSGSVERSKWIKVEATSLKGKKLKKKFKGWEARVFQHEYDHLEGTVYIDHLNDEDRAEVAPVLEKLVENFGEGGAL